VAEHALPNLIPRRVRCWVVLREADRGHAAARFEAGRLDQAEHRPDAAGHVVRVERRRARVEPVHPDVRGVEAQLLVVALEAAAEDALARGTGDGDGAALGVQAVRADRGAKGELGKVPRHAPMAAPVPLSPQVSGL
jgi:hypothetical protein